MSIAHRRKKQPDIVRNQLLDVAARLCVERGLHALTLDAVAKEAGVSKGGLLHHFGSKDALLKALSGACLDDLQRRIDKQMAKDKVAKGRFSRAYLLVAADRKRQPEDERWDNLAMVLASDVGMRSEWHAWLAQRLAEHKETDNTMSSLIARFASDGLWLSDLGGSPGLSVAKRKRLIERLVAMTRDK